MAITNDVLSEQIKATELRSAERHNTLRDKLDENITEQRKHNDMCERRLRAVEVEQARTDERVSQLRNIFGGIQLMVGGILTWIGLR